MANVLNNYNPQMWAMEALDYLSQKTGFASTVHRGYEQERQSFSNRGDTMNFRRPQELTAQDIFVSGSPAEEDIDTPNLSLTLDQHQAVRFAVTDKDLAFSGDRLITEHIAPAMDALGRKVDADIAAAMAAASPFVVDHGGYATDPAAIIASVRQQFVENNVPTDQLKYAVSPATYAVLSSDVRFAAYEGAAGTGVATQTSGILGSKYGFEWHESQSLPSITLPSITPLADPVGAAAAAAGAGATSIAVDGFGTSSADLAGQILSVQHSDPVGSGSTAELYLVESGTLSGGAETLTLASGLRKPLADNDVITVMADLDGGITAQTQDIAYAPRSTALVVAPLPMHAANMGANVFTATDPESGLSVRARLNYDNPNGKVNVIFDILYGIKVLDERMIVRVADVS